MSNRLGGKQGTAYLGTNANQPPNWVFSDRDPNQFDINNVSLGDMWLNQTDESVWILVSLAGIPGSKGSLAHWVSLANDATGALSTLAGNTGGKVAGDSDANINFFGDGVGITITGTPGTHSLVASLVGGGSAATSFPTDSGTANPAAGVLIIKADSAGLNSGSSVSFSATGNTITFNVTDSNDNTIIGKDSGNTTISGGDNTIIGEASGSALTSGDDNTIIGGTAGASLTTGSNNIIVGSDAGSALTTSDSDNTLIGEAGFAGAEDYVAINAGAAGITMLHNFPGTNASTTNGQNVFLGSSAGNFTLAGGAGDASNDGIGSSALSSLTTGARNNAMGSFSLSKVTTGTNNIGVGHNAGFNSGGNTGLVTGAHNVLVGYTAGSAYTAAESNNIILGVVAGTAAESNVLRIGSATGSGTGQINKAFISGIRGITPTINDGIPLYINSVGQLGTVGTGGTSIVQTVTGNSGGAVGPAAGNINIIGDGTTATVVGNPGTNTLTISAIGGGGGTLTVLAADTGSAAPAAGTINIITDNAAQGAGSSVLFSGAADTITLIVTDEDSNTIIGANCGNATLTGTSNTVLGAGSLAAVTTGSDNVCIGDTVAEILTTGSSNVMVGLGAGQNLDTGSHNVLVGDGAGVAYTAAESSNILLNSDGVAAESHVLRIGQATGAGVGEINKAFISGIVGITPDTADGIPLFIGSDGQLGTVGNGDTTMVQTITGNSGGAVGPAAGNINIVGDGTTATVVGNPGTNTLTITALGGGGGTLTVLAGDTGSATPSAGTINIISNVASQACGSSVKFTGSSNNITLAVTDTNNNTIIGSGSGNATLTGTKNTILGSGGGAALTSGTSNIFIGRQAGSLVTTGTGNFLCGDASLATVLKGTTTSTGLYAFGASTGSVFLNNWGGASSGNTFVGYGAAGNFNAGQQSSNKNNTGCGVNTFSLITTGSNNIAIGNSAGVSLTTGSSNTLLGTAAGFNYASSESSNICIGVGATGTATESNVLRIGGGTGSGTGQINKAFVSGVRGITTSISNAIPVLIDSAGQLGTAGGGSVITSLTGNSGGAVSATGGNVNVVGDGTTINVAGSPGTSTLTISAMGGGGGNPTFSVYLTTNQVVPVSPPGIPPILIAFDTVIDNFGSAYDLGSSTFTAPVTGSYTFSYTTFTRAPTDTRKCILFQTTNDTFVIPTNFTGTGVQEYNSSTYYVFMDSGDTAQILYSFPSTATTGTIIIYGTSQTFTPGIVTSFSGSLVAT